MKKIAILVLFAAAGILTYNIVIASPGSMLYQVKKRTVDWVESIGISKSDYQEQLNYKTAELAEYEKALAWADEEVVKMENTSGPACPRTGIASTYKVTGDPRPQIRQHIDDLKTEIATLNEKIKD
jgi:cell division protein FtsL